MKIFPQPQRMELFQGEYRFPSTLDRLELTEFFRHIRNGTDGVRLTSAPLLAREEYHLTVAEDGVEIAFSCDEGLFRAATTLVRAGAFYPACTSGISLPFPAAAICLISAGGKYPAWKRLKG